MPKYNASVRTDLRRVLGNVKNTHTHTDAQCYGLWHLIMSGKDFHIWKCIYNVLCGERDD